MEAARLLTKLSQKSQALVSAAVYGKQVFKTSTDSKGRELDITA